MAAVTAATAALCCSLRGDLSAFARLAGPGGCDGSARHVLDDMSRRVARDAAAPLSPVDSRAVLCCLLDGDGLLPHLPCLLARIRTSAAAGRVLCRAFTFLYFIVEEAFPTRLSAAQLCAVHDAAFGALRALLAHGRCFEAQAEALALLRAVVRQSEPLQPLGLSRLFDTCTEVCDCVGKASLSLSASASASADGAFGASAAGGQRRWAEALRLIGALCAVRPAEMAPHRAAACAAFVSAGHWLAARRRAEQSIGEGLLLGLADYMSNFPLGPDAMVLLHPLVKSAMMLADTSRNYRFCKAALQLLRARAAPLRRGLTGDAESYFALLRRLWAHKNTEVRRAAYGAASSFFQALAEEWADATEQKEILQHMFESLERALHDGRGAELTFAVTALGCLSRPIVAWRGVAYVEAVSHLLARRCEALIVSAAAGASEELVRLLPHALTALAALLLEWPIGVKAEPQLHYAMIHMTLRLYPQEFCYERIRSKIGLALLKLLMAMYMRGVGGEYVFSIFARQLLTLGCCYPPGLSHPPDVEIIQHGIEYNDTTVDSECVGNEGHRWGSISTSAWTHKKFGGKEDGEGGSERDTGGSGADSVHRAYDALCATLLSTPHCVDLWGAPWSGSATELSALRALLRRELIAASCDAIARLDVPLDGAARLSGKGEGKREKEREKERGGEREGERDGEGAVAAVVTEFAALARHAAQAAEIAQRHAVGNEPAANKPPPIPLSATDTDRENEKNEKNGKNGENGEADGAASLSVRHRALLCDSPVAVSGAAMSAKRPRDDSESISAGDHSARLELRLDVHCAYLRAYRRSTAATAVHERPAMCLWEALVSDALAAVDSARWAGRAHALLRSGVALRLFAAGAAVLRDACDAVGRLHCTAESPRESESENRRESGGPAVRDPRVCLLTAAATAVLRAVLRDELPVDWRECARGTATGDAQLIVIDAVIGLARAAIGIEIEIEIEIDHVVELLLALLPLLQQEGLPQGPALAAAVDAALCALSSRGGLSKLCEALWAQSTAVGIARRLLYEALSRMPQVMCVEFFVPRVAALLCEVRTAGGQSGAAHALRMLEAMCRRCGAVALRGPLNESFLSKESIKESFLSKESIKESFLSEEAHSSGSGSNSSSGSRGLTVAIVKAATAARASSLPLWPPRDALALRQAAHRCLAAVVIATQSQEEVFTRLLFDERQWNRIVNTECTYGLPGEADFLQWAESAEAISYNWDKDPIDVDCVWASSCTGVLLHTVDFMLSTFGANAPWVHKVARALASPKVHINARLVIARLVQLRAQLFAPSAALLCDSLVALTCTEGLSDGVRRAVRGIIALLLLLLRPPQEGICAVRQNVSVLTEGLTNHRDMCPEPMRTLLKEEKEEKGDIQLDPNAFAAPL